MGPIPPIVQRVSDEGNIEPKESPPIGGKGGSEGDGRREPADRNTELLFFRFFHLARLFWNHTWRRGDEGVKGC